jgi:luciferase family oxidoreductase group 1
VQHRDIPLSVLDLATVSDGRTSTEALAETTAFARRADELGYLRFWVAEHHNMPTVASTSPPVLMAHLAAVTDRIRLGSGGVMLPNHAPLVVAEQFALLEALHPGRIDLGVGRAPGTDGATALALRRSPDNLDAEDFPRNLIDVMGLLGDRRAERGLWNRFAATPVATSTPEIVLLGSSGFSAQLAGMLGLPFAFAHHFDMGGTLQAVEIYQRHFEPSAVLERPYTIVSASVLCATDHDRANWLANPAQLRRYGMRTGRLYPLLAPEDAARHPEMDAANAMTSYRIVGTPDEVVAGLDRLAAATDASELMLHTATYSLADRLASIELVAEHWPALAGAGA